MATERPVVNDPRLQRAVAHPLRSRILSELNATGSMRAADVARELGVAANLASFHLRQLAKYGLVEEDPTAARDRRDRVWRPVQEAGLRFSLADLEQQPGGRAAVAVFRRTASAFAHALVDEVYNAERDPETLRVVTQTSLRFTRAEAVQFAADLEEVIDSWAARTRGRDDDRRTYVVFQVLEPHPALDVDLDSDGEEVDAPDEG
jgi:predicted ArsR family transcriptional regulator